MKSLSSKIESDIAVLQGSFCKDVALQGPSIMSTSVSLDGTPEITHIRELTVSVQVFCLNQGETVSDQIL